MAESLTLSTAKIDAFAKAVNSATPGTLQDMVAHCKAEASDYANPANIRAIYRKTATLLRNELKGWKRNPARKSAAKKKTLSVPEKHQLKIARATLRMHDDVVAFAGGPSKAEAREIIFKLTGKRPRASNPQKTPRKKRASNSKKFLMTASVGSKVAYLSAANKWVWNRRAAKRFNSTAEANKAFDALPTGWAGTGLEPSDADAISIVAVSSRSSNPRKKRASNPATEYIVFNYSPQSDTLAFLNVYDAFAPRSAAARFSSKAAADKALKRGFMPGYQHGIASAKSTAAQIRQAVKGRASSARGK